MRDEMKGYGTLISAGELAPHVAEADWAIVDCRSRLAEPEFGSTAYLGQHIAGAVHAHMEEDLSGPVVRGKTGRHPLPEVGAIAGRLSAWGVDAGVQVVAYDDSGGSSAARLWWLLRWLGHERVAVLDGGWPAWLAGGLPVRGGAAARPARRFIARPRPELLAGADLVEQARRDPGWRVLDARALERYRGENETIDPVAGRIPGALSAPYAENLRLDGRFKPAAELRERYGAMLNGVPAAQTICYCGSGVTAAHDLLAMAHAGLGAGRLYAGSWSEWILDPRRKVERG